MKITAEMLEEAEACRPDIRKFKKEWPDGCNVTKKAVLRAMELGFDFQWAADTLLSKEACGKFFAAPGRADVWDVYIYAESGSEIESAAWDGARKADALAFWRAAK